MIYIDPRDHTGSYTIFMVNDVRGGLYLRNVGHSNAAYVGED
jgi:hypothetical protein